MTLYGHEQFTRLKSTQHLVRVSKQRLLPPATCLLRPASVSSFLLYLFLAGRTGDKCRNICVDLPGHGARWRDPLTVGSAMSALKAAVDSEVGLAGGPAKALLVGIGLGGCAADRSQIFLHSFCCC